MAITDERDEGTEPDNDDSLEAKDGAYSVLARLAPLAVHVPEPNGDAATLGTVRAVRTVRRLPHVP